MGVIYDPLLGQLHLTGAVPSAPVTSVNGQTGAVVLNASNVGAANQSLSNLTSPTAINQDILPGTDDTNAIGIAAQRFSNINATHSVIAGKFPYVGGTKTAVLTADAAPGPGPGLLLYDGASMAYAIWNDGTNTIIGDTGAGLDIASFAVDNNTFFNNANSPNLNISSTNGLLTYLPIQYASGVIGSIKTINSTATQDLTVSTGDASAGNSGNIIISTGSATATRGNIMLEATLIDAGSVNISNVANPVQPNDAVTLTYANNHYAAGTGNDLAETISINNNQASAIALFSLTTPQSFFGYLTIVVNATTPLTELIEIRAVKLGNGTYTLFQVNYGDSSGVVFTIDSATGQIKYTSPNFTGFVNARVGVRVFGY